MSVKYVVGDIVELTKKGEYDFVVHGCNCFNTMGSGVAKALRDAFPEVYEADCETVKGDRSKLGRFSLAYLGNTVIVVNAYTQYNYNPKEKPFDYLAFTEVLATLKLRFGECKLLMPKIGAGLAGGDWEIIEKILIISGLDITVCILEEE